MCRQCPLAVILRATFEWREIDNQLRSFGVALPDALPGHDDTTVIDEAVELAHEDLAFSKRMTRLLCAVHGATIAEIASTPIDMLADRTGAPIDIATDVPFLWALIVDRRPETSRLAWAWLRRSPAFVTPSVRPSDSRDPS